MLPVTPSIPRHAFANLQESARTRRRRSSKQGRPSGAPGFRDARNVSTVSSTFGSVGEGFFWAVPSTRYECRLPSDPSTVQELRELLLTSDGHAPGSRTWSGVAASMHSPAGPCSSRGRDQAPLAASAAGDQHGSSIQMTSGEARATGSSEDPPFAESAQEQQPQPWSRAFTNEMMCEGMHAVGGETQPCILPDTDLRPPAKAPENCQLAVLAKTAPEGHPSNALFRCRKRAVHRSGEGSSTSTAGRSDGRGTGVVVERPFACGRKRRTARAVLAQLRRFTADDVFLGQFVMCGQDSRYCGGANLTPLCLPLASRLCFEAVCEALPGRRHSVGEQMRSVCMSMTADVRALTYSSHHGDWIGRQ